MELKSWHPTFLASENVFHTEPIKCFQEFQCKNTERQFLLLLDQQLEGCKRVGLRFLAIVAVMWTQSVCCVKECDA